MSLPIDRARIAKDVVDSIYPDRVRSVTLANKNAFALTTSSSCL